jgi:hypothetical protein
METPGTREKRAFMTVFDWILFGFSLSYMCGLWICFFVWYSDTFKISGSMILNYWLPLISIIVALFSIANILWTTSTQREHSKIVQLFQEIDLKV